MLTTPIAPGVEAPTEEILDSVVHHLDRRIQETLEEIQQTPFWKTVLSPDTPNALRKAIMRETYLEVYSYQPHVIEATISVIARMPKQEAKMIRTMLIHQAEEADHGEIALRDYVALGGNEEYARTRRMSPASFATASIWWGLVHMEDPFTYLGALYPFEGITPIVCQSALSILRDGDADFPADSFGFVELHATEDVKHAHLVRKLLKDVMRKFPHTMESIKYGIELFLQVYPIPVWMAAYERAMRESQEA